MEQMVAHCFSCLIFFSLLDYKTPHAVPFLLGICRWFYGTIQFVGHVEKAQFCAPANCQLQMTRQGSIEISWQDDKWRFLLGSTYYRAEFLMMCSAWSWDCSPVLAWFSCYSRGFSRTFLLKIEGSAEWLIGGQSFYIVFADSKRFILGLFRNFGMQRVYWGWNINRWDFWFSDLRSGSFNLNFHHIKFSQFISNWTNPKTQNLKNL